MTRTPKMQQLCCVLRADLNILTVELGLKARNLTKAQEWIGSHDRVKASFKRKLLSGLVPTVSLELGLSN